jgi:hypothetical protein
MVTADFRKSGDQLKKVERFADVGRLIVGEVLNFSC